MTGLLRRRKFWGLHVGAILVLGFASGASAQGFSIAQATAAPPAELSAAVRAVLGDSVLRVSGPNGLICEIWLRKSVPAKAAATALGVTFTQLDEGTLVAAMRVAADTRDYRRQAVKAGVYTMRYCLSPVNGNHQDVAPQRDFLLAIPASADADPATVSEAQTIELSKKTIGSAHPSPWPLFPGEGDAGAAAAMKHDTDDDLWIAEFTVTLGSTPTRIGLVVSGFGPQV
jgi:hypothetical protein